MKLTTWSILSVIVLPVIAWAGQTIFSLSERVVKTETRLESTEQATKSILLEIRCDIKQLKGETCQGLSR